jgi:gamma-glutamylcyclotransferase (GGCT)/AIG2-like uncharacterized protein YtfP
MNNLLFVYGTLLNENNEYAVYLKNHSRFYSYGKIKGKLYDIGEYPGAILSAKNKGYIYGSILELEHPKDVFPVIDDYEGYGNNQSMPNEFVRLVVPVETASALINCWVYVYNLPSAELDLIKSGRYLK